MGTQCNIIINGITYYKHYDGYSGGITLNLLDSIIDNKICLFKFIEIGKIEKYSIFKNLPLFNISDTKINNIDIYDFMLNALNQLVNSKQRLYQKIKEEDARTAYFSQLRGDSQEETKRKMRLSEVFKEYPTEVIFEKQFNLLKKLNIN